MNLDQIIAAAAALGQITAAAFALLALFVSIRTSNRQSETSERIARESDELAAQLARQQAEFAERRAREHTGLQFEQLKMQRDSDILRWTERCIDILSEADVFIGAGAGRPLDDTGRTRLSSLLARLSAQIDHGRLYFPNATPDKQVADKQGAAKPEAYRGFRQRIISVLVRAHDELSKAGTARNDGDITTRRGKLIELRRIFVSEAQVAIDPRRFIALREINAVRVERGIAVQIEAESDWAGEARSANPGGTP